MSSLIVFPREILLQIFANVSEEDRFEACQVSRDWFFLTLKTYKAPIMKSKVNPLLELMAAFYNQATGTSTYSTWYQLYRYIKPEEAAVVVPDVPAYIKVFKKCKAHIKKLDICLKDLLDEDLTSFPRLERVNCYCFEMSPGTKMDKLKQYLGPFTLLRRDTSLAVFTFGLELCGQSTYALSKIIIVFEILNDNQKRDAIRAIKQCRTVKDFLLEGPLISKEWFGIIPASTRRLCFRSPEIDSSIKNIVTAVNDLLFYCCSDWKRVCTFVAIKGVMSSYTCYPQKMKEELQVQANDIDAFKLMENGFKCTSMEIDSLRNQLDLKKRIPATVERLCLRINFILKPFSLQRVCEDPTNLKVLSVVQDGFMDDDELLLDPFGFPHLSSLNTLEMSDVGSTALATVLRSCPLLKTLIIQGGQENAFTDLPRLINPDDVSSSISTLNVRNCSLPSHILRSHFQNLKTLHYKPGKYNIPCGFLHPLRLDFMKIESRYSKYLCLEAISSFYPYKFVQVIGSSEHKLCTYVLSNRVQPLRKLMNEIETNDYQTCNNYAQGFSVAFIGKKFKVHSNLEEFLSNVDFNQRK